MTELFYITSIYPNLTKRLILAISEPILSLAKRKGSTYIASTIMMPGKISVKETIKEG
jgi:hypothetical protein